MVVLISGAGIVSILYTIPIFGKSMRLRDFSFIKIFLIAIVWSYVTGFVPMYEQDISMVPIVLYLLEIGLFFIAITIPFDIRDFHVDTANKVGTIPTLIGRDASIYLSIMLLIVTIMIDIAMTSLYDFDIIGMVCMLFTVLITARIVYFVRDKENDYYFSGLMDTSIMFPYTIYVLLLYFV